MKIDPYKNKEKFLNWKEKIKEEIPRIGKYNSDVLKQYLNDMEIGVNVSHASKKGARSYIRLNSLRTRILLFAIAIKEKLGVEKITDIKEEQLHSLSSMMRSGVIRRKDGKEYLAVRDYIKDFKAFWHWWMKINKKKGIEIADITSDLDTSREKPKWVYLTEEQVRKIANYSKFDYKVLILFLFDTGIRAPTELVNLKVSDLYGNCKELNIRDEVSKTFGRRLKLMICSDILKEYIKIKNLKQDDYLFPINNFTVNKYLHRAAKNLFGEEETEAGGKYSQLTMYDFRHCSCCYWLPRYKSESALKYRFGWKKSDKIHYYSELLGMKDTINQEDMLIDVTKTEIEKELEKARMENVLVHEQMKAMESQMAQILLKIEGMTQKINSNEIEKVIELT